MPGNDKYGRIQAKGDSIEFFDQFQVMRGQSGQLIRGVELFDHVTAWHGSTGPWTNTKDAAGVALAQVAGQYGGVARLDTSATSGTRNTAVTDLNYKASAGGMLLEARVKLDVLTSVRLNVGFTDATTSGGTGKVVFEVATTTVTRNAAADAVCAVFDSAATAANWQLVGSKASTATAAVDSGSALVAATFDILRLGVNPDGHAWLQVNDNKIVSVPNAITAGTLVTPYIGVVNATAASRKFDFDYVYVKCANAAGV